ncbi:MAG: hypothetical protein R3217_05205 [Gammaproteobacteria bacterium]|nr:hypothetical protein [Gammaproteobacteria bacterium]
MRQMILALLFLLAVFLPVLSQAGQPPAPCSTPEYRQFDFWLGSWDVYNKAGKKVGENRITLEQGTCVLHEHWRSAQGNTGESFNMYDAKRGVWHQTWVAATGNLLLLDGELRDGAMVLSGSQPLPQGGTMLNRITWTPMADGSVEQRWDQSTDDGQTWKTGFLGIYRRQAD